MASTTLPAPCEGADTVQLVLLPGAYSAPEAFIDEGFVTALQTRGVAAQVTLADAHLGYLLSGSLLTRLHEDVVAPLRQRHPGPVWLVGISLGGLAALVYRQHHPDMLDGVLLIAPYLGEPPLLQAIHDAGGPQAWARQAGPDDESDPAATLWRTLAGSDLAATPPIHLAYGRDDRFADGHRLMASLLPAGRSRARPGAHDWTTWRALWSDFLDDRPWPTDCTWAG